VIDCHCHLEQPDYARDREEVIDRCRQKLRAIITCCAHPDGLGLTLEMVERHKGFVFATAGLHPIHVGEVDKEQRDEFVSKIIENQHDFCGIGEVGLDYWEVEAELWEEQRQVFLEFIELAKRLRKPIVVHARKAFEDAIEILEQCEARGVLMHLFGARHLLKRVLDNGWLISVGPIVLRSKSHRKIVRDTPMHSLLLETDSPWFGPGERNEPWRIQAVVERVAEVKKLSLEEVDQIVTQNAIGFFKLPIKL
jgi:TatD DNase family protein